MNEQDDRKWLDELISENIDTSEPKFDAEQWKQKYPGEFRALVERGARQTSTGRFGVLGIVLRSRIAQVAAAAVLIIAVGLFVGQLDHGGRQQGLPQQGAKSPAEMVTAMSLRMAYRRGGMEALEQQCDEAVRLLGASRPSSSLGDLVRDLNG